MTTEEWRAIPGWEGFYEVSNVGNVRGVERRASNSRRGTRRVKARQLPRRLNTRGYWVVNLTRNGRPYPGMVHRLVALAFLGAPPAGTEVCHNDGVKTNCCVGNLRYDTHKANMADTIAHGANPFLNREDCPRGHPLRAPNLVPCKLPKRDCLACSRARAMVTYARRQRKAVPDLQALSDRHYVAIVGNHHGVT